MKQPLLIIRAILAAVYPLPFKFEVPKELKQDSHQRHH